jgi:hypothetical protein
MKHLYFRGNDDCIYNWLTNPAMGRQFTQSNTYIPECEATTQKPERDGAEHAKSRSNPRGCHPWLHTPRELKLTWLGVTDQMCHTVENLGKRQVWASKKWIDQRCETGSFLTLFGLDYVTIGVIRLLTIIDILGQYVTL